MSSSIDFLNNYLSFSFWSVIFVWKFTRSITSMICTRNVVDTNYISDCKSDSRFNSCLSRPFVLCYLFVEILRLTYTKLDLKISGTYIKSVNFNFIFVEIP